MFSGTLVSAEGAERLGILLLAAVGTNYLSGSNFYRGFRFLRQFLLGAAVACRF